MSCFFLILASGTSFGGVLADSAADFSGTQGANNWYYGYFPGGNIGAFTKLPTYNAQVQAWEHPTYGPPWTLLTATLMHPNGANDVVEEWATREWISTYAGQVVVTGHVAKADTNPASSGVYGRIYWNRQLVYQHFIAGTDGTGVNYAISLTLNKGDILDFSLAPNGADNNDATVFSATVSTEYDSVSVDFGAPVSVKSALGFLDGFDDIASNGNPQPGTPPTNDMIVPLHPQYWRGTLNEYKRVQLFAPAIPFDLVLDDDVWGWAQYNYNGNAPPWQDMAGYQSALTTYLGSSVPNQGNFIYEVWNEPDDGWAVLPGQPGYHVFWSGSAQQFYETYLAAFQVVRRVKGPSAIVAGPSFATYSHQGIQDFLEYCLANGCEVNSLTWHELNDSAAFHSLPADVQDARTSFLQNPRYAPLRIQRIDVNEIVGPIYTPQPAGTLAYYSALEASGADAAAHSCWTDTVGNSQCADGTLDGLLTDGTFLPRAAWWLHKSYADGVGGRVRAVSSNPNIFALASASITGATTPQILIGNSNFQDIISNASSPVSVNLSLANLQAVAAIGGATNADVRIELIPNSGTAAVSQLNVIAETVASINKGAAQISLPPIDVGQVYRVTLVPPAPQVSTIASGGVFDPWNYTQGAAPGSWVAIAGVNLGPSVPQSWNPQPDSALPTTLGGVSVSIAGIPGALSYVSASQVNALIPANVPLGADTVVVSVNGLAGKPYVLQVDAARPAVYALPDTGNTGNFYVTAVLSATSQLIGKPGVDPRVSRGANPGDLVDLYMVGLGATQDPSLFVTNQLFSEAAPIRGAVTIDLAGQFVTPVFSGLISPGLYLVRFSVPGGTPAGDAPILIGVNGEFTRGQVYLTVSSD